MKFSRLTFIKDAVGNWYANLPEYIAQGGTHEDTQMVLGADTLLDILAQGADTVNLRVSDEFEEGWAELQLSKLSSEEGGGYYKLQDEILGVKYDMELWLCEVLRFVMGYIPNSIWFVKC